jgi:hypothetical protein
MNLKVSRNKSKPKTRILITHGIMKINKEKMMKK